MSEFNVAESVRKQFLIEALDARRLLSVTLPTDEVSETSDPAAEVEILVIADESSTDSGSADEEVFFDESVEGEALIIVSEVAPEEGAIDPAVCYMAGSEVIDPAVCYFGESEIVDPIDGWVDENEVITLDDGSVIYPYYRTLGGEEAEVEILVIDDGGSAPDSGSETVTPPAQASSLASGADTHGLATDVLGSKTKSIVASSDEPLV